MTIQKKPVYTPADLHGFDAETQLSRPGEYPFTRGIHPTMYRGRLWTMRQFAGFGSASDTNRRYKFLLEHGQTGLSVAFDFPTLMGYDADHPRSEGEVGKCGVAISSLADMETLFDGIPLDQVSTSTISRRGCRFSGTSTMTSSRRSPNFARRGVSGPVTCASAMARRARGRG